MSDTSTTQLFAESIHQVWHVLTDDERLDAFRELPVDEARRFFENISPADQALLIQGLPAAEAAALTRSLPPDDVTDLLQAVTLEDRSKIEKMLDAATLREARALLAYAEDEAGGLMNPRFARVRPDVPVEVAILYLRRQTQNNLATLYYAYVLDQNQRLLGVVSFRELFTAPGDRLVQDVMTISVVTVQEDTDQEKVARVIAQHDLLAIPVVDGEGRMRGLVTVDDIVDVVQEEATEDIQKLGAVETLGAPYLDVGFLQMIRKRGGWLSVLFVGEMLTATAMAFFQDEIARVVMLAMFVPLIISSGGNSGSQAATLVVRSLALQELKPRDWLRVFRRELRTGATLGAWLGSLGFLRVIVWQQAGLYDYGPHYMLIAATVCGSLLGVVTFGTITGSMLPLLLRRVGFDPASSSAPFVATLVDVTGLVIYFAVAAFLLRGTLL